MHDQHLTDDTDWRLITEGRPLSVYDVPLDHTRDSIDRLWRLAGGYVCEYRDKPLVNYTVNGFLHRINITVRIIVPDWWDEMGYESRNQFLRNNVSVCHQRMMQELKPLHRIISKSMNSLIQEYRLVVPDPHYTSTEASST